MTLNEKIIAYTKLQKEQEELKLKSDELKSSIIDEMEEQGLV